MQRDIGRWHVVRVRFGEGQASAPACRVRARFGCPNLRREPSQAMRPWDWALLGASCVNAVAISWAGINAQAYVTATTFMVPTQP